MHEHGFIRLKNDDYFSKTMSVKLEDAGFFLHYKKAKTYVFKPAILLPGSLAPQHTAPSDTAL